MSAAQGLPARKGGAKALLLTVLGEFVLPNGGGAWTSSLVAAADALGLGEKNARQALSRIKDQGLIESERHGRLVRWALTPAGRQLLETGTETIYSFGRRDVEWNGQWLTAHCPVAESRRAVRNELRAELRYLGFGELSASLLISPRVDRDPELRQVLERLGLLDESTIMWAQSANEAEEHQLVARAWNLDELATSYLGFTKAHRSTETREPQMAFAALVALVHDWRRFPFIDPELPTKLLPSDWPGAPAVEMFHRQHAALSIAAQGWFAAAESSKRQRATSATDAQ